MWFILMAIALLVALTITITRSTDSAQQNGTRERDRILATAILRQAKGMATAVDQARGNNVPENNISFENQLVTGYTTVFSSSGTGSTVPYGIFFSSGAGLTYTAPDREWLDSSQSSQPHYGEWYFYGTTCIPDVGTGDSTTCTASSPASMSELIVSIPGITASLCAEINRQTGVTNETNPIRPPTATTSVYGSSPTQFVGTFTNGGLLMSSGGAFTGKQAGCFEGGSSSPSGGYHFYEVLIPR